MSESVEQSPERGVRQEQDRVPIRGLLWSCAVVVAVVAGSLVLVGWWALGPASREALPESARPARVPDRIGRLFQTPIGPDDRTDRRAPLGRGPEDGFAWVDRERGLVRIPLDVAVELHLREEAP